MADLSNDEDDSSNDLSVLEWMNHFFSSLDIKDYVVSRRRRYNKHTASSIIKPSIKPSLYTCFLASLDEQHNVVESLKKKEKTKIQDQVKREYLKAEIVPVKGNVMPERGKFLVDFEKKEDSSEQKLEKNEKDCVASNEVSLPTSEKTNMLSVDDALALNGQTLNFRKKEDSSSEQKVGKHEKDYAASTEASLPTSEKTNMLSVDDALALNGQTLNFRKKEDSISEKKVGKHEKDYAASNEASLPTSEKTNMLSVDDALALNGQRQYKIIASSSNNQVPKNVNSLKRKVDKGTNFIVAEQGAENPVVSTVKQHIDNIEKTSSHFKNDTGLEIKNLYFMEDQAGEKEIIKTRDMFRKEQAIQDMRSSKQQATCKWDIPMFAEHVTKENFKVLDSLIDDIITDGEVDDDCLSNEMEIELQQRLIDDSKVYADVQNFTIDNSGLKLKDLAINDANETVVRSFINHILATVSNSLGITLHPEQYLPGKEFSCPRCDYVFKMDGINIGSVEVKAATYVNKNVIVQLLLQLLKMQCFNRSSNMCYFGLLTDGYRYVFVLLKGTEFIFESEIDLKRQSVITSTNEVINVKEKVRIFHANTWDELLDIVKRSVMLLKDCIHTLNKCISQPKLTDFLSKKAKEKNNGLGRKRIVKNKFEDGDNDENGTLKKIKKCEPGVTYEIDKDGVINID